MTQLAGRKPPRPRDAPPPTRARTEEMQRWQALAEMAKAAAEPAPPPARVEPSAGRELRRWLGWTLGGLAGAIVAFEAARFLFSDAPPATQLDATVQEAAQRVLTQWRAPAAPWRLEGARAQPVWREGAGTRHYDALVTLRLEAALYAPAVSNGTESYRLLQRSLADARVAARQHGLDVSVPALQDVPELPELLDVTAKEGEKLVVRVPFTARLVAMGDRRARAGPRPGQPPDRGAGPRGLGQGALPAVRHRHGARGDAPADAAGAGFRADDQP